MKKTIINKITKMKNSDLTRIGLKNIIHFGYFITCALTCFYIYKR